ncbi:MAG: hypothetical protein OYL97_00915 [Candidatus Poribacteria bacterium]|nr:hypothetical protein [Candidatus Poribacteria bacterium]
MASIENPTELKVEHLLSGVKQLSPVELDEFTQKFVEWQRQQEAEVGEDVDPEASDAEVLASIRANLLLPKKENRRYWQLRCKREDETLSDTELSEYQELVNRLTILNTKRLEGIVILVHRWGKPAEDIIAEFGLRAGNDVI